MIAEVLLCSALAGASGLVGFLVGCPRPSEAGVPAPRTVTDNSLNSALDNPPAPGSDYSSAIPTQAQLANALAVTPRKTSEVAGEAVREHFEGTSPGARETAKRHGRFLKRQETWDTCDLLSQGLTNAEIGQRTGRSPCTVQRLRVALPGVPASRHVRGYLRCNPQADWPLAMRFNRGTIRKPITERQKPEPSRGFGAQTPEGLERIRQAALKRWADPAFKAATAAKISEGQKKRHARRSATERSAIATKAAETVRQNNVNSAVPGEKIEP
jgi:hypothetical protein